LERVREVWRRVLPGSAKLLRAVRRTMVGERVSDK
jgi:hypothetical protein